MLHTIPYTRPTILIVPIYHYNIRKINLQNKNKKSPNKNPQESLSLKVRVLKKYEEINNDKEEDNY